MIAVADRIQMPPKMREFRRVFSRTGQQGVGLLRENAGVNEQGEHVDDARDS